MSNKVNWREFSTTNREFLREIEVHLFDNYTLEVENFARGNTVKFYIFERTLHLSYVKVSGFKVFAQCRNLIDLVFMDNTYFTHGDRELFTQSRNSE